MNVVSSQSLLAHFLKFPVIITEIFEMGNLLLRSFLVVAGLATVVKRRRNLIYISILWLLLVNILYRFAEVLPLLKTYFQ